jgi:hypothetical protein
VSNPPNNNGSSGGSSGGSGGNSGSGSSSNSTNIINDMEVERVLNTPGVSQEHFREVLEYALSQGNKFGEETINKLREGSNPHHGTGQAPVAAREEGVHTGTPQDKNNPSKSPEPPAAPVVAAAPIAPAPTLVERAAQVADAAVKAAGPAATAHEAEARRHGAFNSALSMNTNQDLAVGSQTPRPGQSQQALNNNIDAKIAEAVGSIRGLLSGSMVHVSNGDGMKLTASAGQGVVNQPEVGATRYT